MAAAVLLFVMGSAGGTPVVISQGYVFPFTISQAPATFGAYAGSFFIPDTTTGDIMVMPPGGGAPTVFQHADGLIRGGLFLPPTFGAFGGQFAQLSVITNPVDPTTLFDPAVAPASFGAYGGQLFVTSQFGGDSILRVDQSGNISPFSVLPQIEVPGLADPITIGPTGITFAPAGFGSVGGMMLTNSIDADTNTVYIAAIDPQGNASLFATIPLRPGEFGPRQMAFAPADFGAYAGMLFLSIASSNDNSGILGAVDAIDASGHDVATLVQGSDVLKFNPRGLLFQPGGELLISDASDPIYLAGPSDFSAAQVPEPASTLLLLTAMAAFLFYSRAAQSPQRRRSTNGLIRRDPTGCSGTI